MVGNGEPHFKPALDDRFGSKAAVGRARSITYQAVQCGCTPLVWASEFRAAARRAIANWRTRSIAHWFKRLYASLGFDGCSSHSGRRTFITRAARKVSAAGGSLRDVQQLAGHASLQTTQRYVEGSTDAKRRLVAMI